jgi:hypothetical protein
MARRIVYGDGAHEYTVAPLMDSYVIAPDAAPDRDGGLFDYKFAQRQDLPRPRYWLAGLGDATPPPVITPAGLVARSLRGMGQDAPDLFGPPVLPVVIAFDPALPYAEQVGDNRGCPPGYFAQRVAPGETASSQPASIGIVPGGSVAVRCRLMDGYTPAVNAQETGQAAADSWLNAVNAVGDVASRAASALGTGLQFSLSWIAVLGGLYLLILREKGGR